MDSSLTVPLILPNKARVRVEATPVTLPGDKDVSFQSVKEAMAIDTIQEAIAGIAEMVMQSLEKVAPNKASVEFGIELGIESGNLTALWVKGTGKANLKITLEWTRREPAH